MRTLREVSLAAQQITRIALQTRHQDEGQGGVHHTLSVMGRHWGGLRLACKS